MRGVSEQIVLGTICAAPPGAAAVAGGAHHSVRAAAEVLAAGGNAIDAAIGGMCAAAMAEPVLTSAGGGGFLLYAPLGVEPTYLDFFVNTPGLEPDSKRVVAEVASIPITFGSVENPQAEQVFHAGWATVAVPGALAGYVSAHERWGRLPLSEILRPAARLAEQGLSLDEVQRDFLRLVIDVLSLTPRSAKLFGPAFTEGFFANPQLSALLNMVGADAKDGVARWNQNFLEHMDKHGGLVTAADLDNYQVTTRTPLVVHRNGHRIWTNPPPSFGGTIVLEALGLITPERKINWPVVADALRTATANQRARDIARDAAQVSRGTTHITVVDADGCMVACTTSNGSGSGTEVAGVALNNMLGEEDLNPPGLHGLPPGLRMGSMMTPTMVERPDGTRISFGSGGSERIRSATVCTVLNLVDAHMSLPQAVSSARIHATSNAIELEPPIDAGQFTDELHAGFTVRQWPSKDLFFGGVHGISRAPDGSLEAVGDARRGGTAAVVQLGS